MEHITNFENNIIMIPCYLGYIWSAKQFLKRYLHITNIKEILFLLVMAAGWILTDLIHAQWFLPYLMPVRHVCFIGLVLMLYQSSAEKKIFAASVWLFVLMTMRNICGALLSCLTLIWLHNVKHAVQPVIDNADEYLISYAVALAVVLAVRWVTRHFEGIFHDKINRWYMTAAVPLLIMTAVMDAADWGAGYGILFRSAGNMGIYYDQIFSHVGMCVLAVLNMAAAGSYLYGMNRIYHELRKNGQYQSKLAAYKMLADQYSRSERLRHDMKNHVIALSSLCEKNEWEKLESYLENMKGYGAVGRSGDVTGSHAVDALLYQKRSDADSRQIHWECDVTIPPSCRMDEFDFCVIFGNLLDNAQKACEKLGMDEHRFIQIQAKAVKKCFLIEVKNSAAEEDLLMQDFFGENLSTEGLSMESISGHLFQNKYFQQHGIGLSNVKEIIQRYDGVMRISKENKPKMHLEESGENSCGIDRVFVVSILMPLDAS